MVTREVLSSTQYLPGGGGGESNSSLTIFKFVWVGKRGFYLLDLESGAEVSEATQGRSAAGGDKLEHGLSLLDAHPPHHLPSQPSCHPCLLILGGHNRN